MLILQSQCHGCWWPGDARNQVICSYGIDPILLEYSSFSTIRDLKSLFKSIQWHIRSLTSTTFSRQNNLDIFLHKYCNKIIRLSQTISGKVHVWVAVFITSEKSIQIPASCWSQHGLKCLLRPLHQNIQQVPRIMFSPQTYIVSSWKYKHGSCFVVCRYQYIFTHIIQGYFTIDLALTQYIPWNMYTVLLWFVNGIVRFWVPYQFNESIYPCPSVLLHCREVNQKHMGQCFRTWIHQKLGCNITDRNRA